MRKLEAARDGLSHSIRGATMEQVLEAALDLLLEKQARARGLVKRPRSAALATATLPRLGAARTARARDKARVDRDAGVDAARVWSRPLTSQAPTTAPPPHRRTGPRETITGRRPPRRLGARWRPLLLAARWRRRVRLDAPAGARPHRAVGQVRRPDGGQPSGRLPFPQRPGGPAGVRATVDGAVSRGPRGHLTSGWRTRDAAAFDRETYPLRPLPGRARSRAR